MQTVLFRVLFKRQRCNTIGGIKDKDHKEQTFEKKDYGEKRALQNGMKVFWQAQVLTICNYRHYLTVSYAGAINTILPDGISARVARYVDRAERY